MPLSVAFLKSVLRSDFDNTEKEQDLEIGSIVGLYGQQKSSPKIARSTKLSGLVESYPEKFKYPFHFAAVKRGPEIDLNIITVVVALEDNFCCRMSLNSSALLRTKARRRWGTCAHSTSMRRTVRL